MSEPVQDRSAEQVARARAAGQVSDVLLNLEHTLARAQEGSEDRCQRRRRLQRRAGSRGGDQGSRAGPQAAPAGHVLRRRLAPTDLRPAIARSGPEIQQALRALVAKWQPYAGSETAEAQTFLNELFACHGSDRFEVVLLTELNRQIVEGERDYRPFAYLATQSDLDARDSESHGGGDHSSAGLDGVETEVGRRL